MANNRGPAPWKSTPTTRKNRSARDYCPSARQFIAAIESGDEDRVRQLISQGIDTNTPAESGESALERAICLGERIIVEILLNNANTDLDLPAGKGTYLMIAAANGHSDIVRTLLDSGVGPNATAEGGDTALSLARRNDHGEVVALLTPFITQVSGGNALTPNLAEDGDGPMRSSGSIFPIAFLLFDCNDCPGNYLNHARENVVREMTKLDPTFKDRDQKILSGDLLPNAAASIGSMTASGDIDVDLSNLPSKINATLASGDWPGDTYVIGLPLPRMDWPDRLHQNLSQANVAGYLGSFTIPIAAGTSDIYDLARVLTLLEAPIMERV